MNSLEKKKAVRGAVGILPLGHFSAPAGGLREVRGEIGQRKQKQQGMCKHLLMRFQGHGRIEIMFTEKMNLLIKFYFSSWPLGQGNV